jgi:hypothetical protein
MKKSAQTPPTMDNWQPTDIKKEENPPTRPETQDAVEVQCRRGPIRVSTDIHSSIETRAHLLEQFQAHSDGGFFKSGFPAGSG